MKSKSPNIPDPPQFQSDPNIGWSQDTLKGEVPKLLSLQGLNPALSETINTNPEVTRLTLQALESQLQPSYRRGLQDITNTLEANNQLTGSTTASALTNYESDYMAQLTAAGAQAGIADISRALDNRMKLYGLGLNTAQAVGQTGLSNQSQENQFALQNYENQVAKVLSDFEAQQRKDSLAGQIAGTWLDPYTAGAIGGLKGGSTGYLAGQQSGWNTLTTAASVYSSVRGAGSPNNWNINSPGTTSGNNETIYNPQYQQNGYGLSGYGNLMASNYGSFR